MAHQNQNLRRSRVILKTRYASDKTWVQILQYSEFPSNIIIILSVIRAFSNLIVFLLNDCRLTRYHLCDTREYHLDGSNRILSPVDVSRRIIVNHHRQIKSPYAAAQEGKGHRCIMMSFFAYPSDTLHSSIQWIPRPKYGTYAQTKEH